MKRVQLPAGARNFIRYCVTFEGLELSEVDLGFINFLNSLSIYSWGYVQCFKHWSIVWRVVEWSNRNQY